MQVSGLCRAVPVWGAVEPLLPLCCAVSPPGSPESFSLELALEENWLQSLRPELGAEVWDAGLSTSAPQNTSLQKLKSWEGKRVFLLP